ncbi:MAG: PorP/SprF family type IX secretion system membrane protein [Bacteroidetes bacterium]|nr:PorP/SprF family type IX secretion system membrane protein [Bacteroidota bacterium]MCL2301901.1 PorP/SprF family type IX secretion system membrane protein [Lentimicrobiaceae bacterium]
MILCKRKVFFLFSFLLLTTSNSFGQDAHFSQFYANPLYMNPAFTGTINCPRISFNFRDQWPSIPKNFITFSGSYDQHINALHGGIGVLLSADIEGSGGILQNYTAGVIYNFRVQVTRQFNLQFALQGSYLFSSLNWDKLQFASDWVNPLAPPEQLSNLNDKLSQFDVSVGVVGYTPYLYFGLAVHHLLPIKMNSLRHPTEKWGLKWTAHVGGKITINQKRKDELRFGDIFLYPNVIFISQGKFHYLHEGFYFSFYPFTIGAWLRHNFSNLDAFIMTCGIEYKIFRIGYSYDFNLTKLERSGGAHEISLQFTIPCHNDKVHEAPKGRNNRLSPIPCPRF